MNDNLIHIESIEQFNKETKDTNVIIDFWAEWCGPCRMMSPVFEQLSTEFKGKLKFAKVNTDELGEISQKYGIQGIPSLIVLKNGKEVDRIVGFAPKEMLKAKINSALAKL